eukprot:CAMPEP_0118682308 /NCGR_PEP_ID=MMETSP0800-20121206/5416_1 /TAXON_ID=210618 ORGANISM="Striatella unipunctata, Strain CCMP2910" /NCGR_SAMPLE_ID=MMETSP0800 /ASSEMBLY_ACC=CAM_ASM_000638 /LENGTH=152 /DNA_ID=CAMNT_0006578689 /DNA_START=173 /DNA_END=629 /DNA_ORIENTATION=+
MKGRAVELIKLCRDYGVPFASGDITFDSTIDVHSAPIDYNTKSTWNVVEWMKNEQLSHGLILESAYQDKSQDSKSELLPFTNVTHDFVNTLDYVMFDSRHFQLQKRLDVPRSFCDLNDRSLQNGHLLPSSVWPSDHLAVGAVLQLRDDGSKV